METLRLVYRMIFSLLALIRCGVLGNTSHTPEVVLSGPKELISGTCGTLTLQLRTDGTSTATLDDGNAGGAFYSNAGCSLRITSVTLAGSYTTLYYGNPSARAVTLAATLKSGARGTFSLESTPTAAVYDETECAGLGAGTETCGWTLKLDRSLCAGRNCTKLVIHFSGGGMTCPDPSATATNLAHYAGRGYVAVCARILATSVGSGAYPYGAEAPRVDFLVRRITDHPAVRAAWNGDFLLFSGVSHGATAPVIAMARNDYDVSNAWKGARYTAACFFDGNYDAQSQLSFAFNNQCRTGLSILPYERAYSRYCQWPAGANGTNPATWPALGSCNTSESQRDSLLSITSDVYAIRDWKLVECGSGLNPCLGDVIPAWPIQSLCGRIQATSGHSCSFASFPSTSHLVCGGDANTLSACSSWFEAQLSAKGF